MVPLPKDDADSAERRVAPRTRILKRAKLFFNNRFSTFDCVVRNISASGALLTIDEAAHLPKTFEVRIGEEAERPAKLVYRRGMLAGIRFLDVPAEEEEAVFVQPPAASSGARPAPAGDFGPGDPFHDRAGGPTASARSVPGAPGSIRKLVPETLPLALTRHFRWF